MKKSWIKKSACLFYILTLTGCGTLQAIGDRITGSGNCSSFNETEDGFVFDLSPSKVIGVVGEAFEPKIEASWYNDDLRRVSVNCFPSWSVDVPDALEIKDNRSVKIKKVGIFKLTGTVTGSGGIKTEHIWVMGVPKATEQESNNGIAFATPLSNMAVFGIRNDSDDVDYYYADIPPQTSYEFRLKAAVIGGSEDPFYTPVYSGDLRNSSDERIGEANRAYTNGSTKTERVYLQVDRGPVQHEVPYQVDVEIR